MSRRLLLQRFAHHQHPAGTLLVIEPEASECLIIDPVADATLIACLEDTITLNGLSLAWVLHTQADLTAYAVAFELQQRHIAARRGVGCLSQRSQHNCSAAIGQDALVPERQFDEHERLQLGSCFADIQHFSDGEQVRTGYLFEDFTVLGCCPSKATPVQARPFAPCPLARALSAA